jgi:hypothetical protein
MTRAARWTDLDPRSGPESDLLEIVILNALSNLQLFVATMRTNGTFLPWPTSR